VDHPLAVSLSITAIGMTLLFLALVFFYALMSLMMSAMQERPSRKDMAEPAEKPVGDAAMLQAAAIAVALSRAEAEQALEPSAVPVQVETVVQPAVSPWWILHHHRQLVPPSNARRSL
jgi:Na+-transporting methylmalonyl-CoA/oxaloacetate decarboxylase gamma subunit